MKKLSILSAILMLLLLSGCQPKDKLFVSQEQYNLELGEQVPQDIDFYLDKTKMNKNDLDKVKDMTLNIEIPELSMIEKDETSYLKAGDYKGTITYGKETVNFVVHIQDTVKPTLSGLTSIELPLGEKLNYQEYFKASDKNELKEIHFDESQINYEQAGQYSLVVSVQDINQNETKLDVPVSYITVPDDKVATSELVSDEAGERYITSLATKNRSVHLDVPYYNQFTLGAPVGCESVSLYMALRYQGYVSNMDCVPFISTTPKSPDDNPYHGFVGTVFDQHRYDILPAIFPSALTPWANQYGNALDISGTGTEGVVEQVLKGNPVVVWITAYFAPPEWQTFDWGKGFKNTHTVCVVGYDEATQTIYYNDPYLGANRPVDYNTFKSIYDIQNFGVAILP